jgi:acyl carrier protein
MSAISLNAEQGEDATQLAARIFQSVRSLLESRFEVAADVRPESVLVSDLGIDRIDADDLPLVLEEAFEIDISNSDAECIFTVEDAVNCVLRCYAPRSGNG